MSMTLCYLFRNWTAYPAVANQQECLLKVSSKILMANYDVVAEEPYTIILEYVSCYEERDHSFV